MTSLFYINKITCTNRCIFCVTRSFNCSAPSINIPINQSINQSFLLINDLNNKRIKQSSKQKVVPQILITTVLALNTAQHNKSTTFQIPPHAFQLRLMILTTRTLLAFSPLSRHGTCQRNAEFQVEFSSLYSTRQPICRSKRHCCRNRLKNLKLKLTRH